MESVVGTPSEAGAYEDLEARMPFFGLFAEDAAPHWATGSPVPMRSGRFVVTTSGGTDEDLEGIAVSAAGRAFMLIARMTEDAHARALQLAREQLLTHLQLLGESQQKDILYHCIVHDLASPMSAVRGAVDLMSMDAGVSGEHRKLLAIAQTALAQQERLIQDVLSVFRQESGAGTTGTLDDVDPVACARDVVAELGGAVAWKGVTLTAHPLEGARTAIVHVDRGYLKRVLANFIDNAIRHVRRQGRIDVRVLASADAVELRVEDDGPGVPESVLPRLFAKFGGGGVRTGKAGLGLYFCRITAERWAGEVGHRPLTPKGASFYLRLPARLEV